MTLSGGSDIAVTLHYAEWTRLLRLLDEGALYRGASVPRAESKALADAIRRQCLDVIGATDDA